MSETRTYNGQTIIRASDGTGWIDLYGNDVDYVEPDNAYEHLTYRQACTAAAERQGLTLDVVDYLHEQGVDVELLQTGGFCMVAAVERADGAYVWITASETAADGWLICEYPPIDHDADDVDLGTVLGDDVDLDTLPGIVGRFLAEVAR